VSSCAESALRKQIRNAVKAFGARKRIGEDQGLLRDRRTFSEVVADYRSAEVAVHVTGSLLTGGPTRRFSRWWSLPDLAAGSDHHHDRLAYDGRRPSARAGVPGCRTATVTWGGRPSDFPVGGTEAVEGGPYRVLIPPDLLARKMRELEGLPVLAAEDLVSHRGSKRVGTFVSGWTEPALIDGEPALAGRASGFLDRGRAGELVERIVSEARRGGMGFSYDVRAVGFRPTVVSGETVFELAEFEWRGATVVRRGSAAYGFTQLAAARTRRENPLSFNQERALMLAAARVAPGGSLTAATCADVLAAVDSDGSLSRGEKDAIRRVLGPMKRRLHRREARFR
jgi:hypothetical protein